jgi:hypothetical protein
VNRSNEKHIGGGDIEYTFKAKKLKPTVVDRPAANVGHRFPPRLSEARIQTCQS